MQLGKGRVQGGQEAAQLRNKREDSAFTDGRHLRPASIMHLLQDPMPVTQPL